jgi:hypothetical protein
MNPITGRACALTASGNVAHVLLTNTMKSRWTQSLHQPQDRKGARHRYSGDLLALAE